jgi:hypothetical protein
MAIVHEKHNPNANRPVQVDPKTGKPLPASAVPPRAASPSLDPDPNGSFFGSFFPGRNKKKMAAMEAPPPTLKASATLSDKETQEVEVISMFLESPMPTGFANHFQNSSLPHTSTLFAVP